MPQLILLLSTVAPRSSAALLSTVSITVVAFWQIRMPILTALQGRSCFGLSGRFGAECDIGHHHHEPKTGMPNRCPTLLTCNRTDRQRSFRAKIARFAGRPYHKIGLRQLRFPFLLQM